MLLGNKRSLLVIFGVQSISYRDININSQVCKILLKISSRQSGILNLTITFLISCFQSSRLYLSLRFLPNCCNFLRTLRNKQNAEPCPALFGINHINFRTLDSCFEEPVAVDCLDKIKVVRLCNEFCGAQIFLIMTVNKAWQAHLSQQIESFEVLKLFAWGYLLFFSLFPWIDEKTDAWLNQDIWSLTLGFSLF